jgi:hypothetical protein
MPATGNARTCRTVRCKCTLPRTRQSVRFLICARESWTARKRTILADLWNRKGGGVPQENACYRRAVFFDLCRHVTCGKRFTNSLL